MSIVFGATLIFEEDGANTSNFNIKGTGQEGDSVEITSLTGKIEEYHGEYTLELNIQTSAGTFSATHSCRERPYFPPFDQSLSRPKGCGTIKMRIFDSSKIGGSGGGTPDIFEANAMFFIGK